MRRSRRQQRRSTPSWGNAPRPAERLRREVTPLGVPKVSVMREPARIHEGDTVRTRKPHACGGDTWQVMQAGVDVRLRCATCGRVLVMERPRLLKAAKSILRAEAEVEGERDGG